MSSKSLSRYEISLHRREVRYHDLRFNRSEIVIFRISVSTSPKHFKIDLSHCLLTQ